MIHGKVDTEGLEFDLFIGDVEELNRKAFSNELAITKIKPEELEQMRKAAEKFTHLQEEGKIKEANRYDILFHSLLLQATGNKLVSNLHRVIIHFFQEAENIPKIALTANPARRRDHYLLCQALEKGDIQWARKILHRHLTYKWEKVFKDKDKRDV